MSQLILACKPQGHRDAVGIPLCKHQIDAIEQRPSLFLGHTFGMHGVDILLIHATGIANLINSMREVVREMITPEIAEHLDASPIDLPGPIFVQPFPVPGPRPHILYMATIIPDSKLPLFDAHAHALVVRITPANGRPAQAFRPLDLAFILSESNDYAEQIFRASFGIPSSAVVERTWARDFIHDAPGTPNGEAAGRSHSILAYARTRHASVN